jgi:peptidoglycan hydrolase CwlO-like protein
LKDERGPLLDHLKQIDNHVRAMYKELLDEAAANKRLEQSIAETNTFITQIKENIKKKMFK